MLRKRFHRARMVCKKIQDSFEHLQALHPVREIKHAEQRLRHALIIPMNSLIELVIVHALVAIAHLRRN